MSWKGCGSSDLVLIEGTIPVFSYSGGTKHHTLAQDIRYPGQCFKSGPPGHEGGLLPTRSRVLVFEYVIIFLFSRLVFPSRQRLYDTKGSNECMSP